MDKSWIGLSLLGALAYGIFSLIFSLVHKKIKKDSSAQVTYASLVDTLTFPFSLVFFIIWSYYYPESYQTLFDHINWPLFFVFVLFSVSTNPVHSLVINAGGSLGQQTMYSLAILPVLLGGYFMSGERLTPTQWIGIFLASLGTFFMTSKTNH
tara:strand:+ start:8787 stop:9245 length:459 start_codon:yes stop_codon:yes gene_type:complete